jgi:hypothetical protein
VGLRGQKSRSVILLNKTPHKNIFLLSAAVMRNLAKNKGSWCGTLNYVVSIG